MSKEKVLTKSELKKVMKWLTDLERDLFFTREKVERIYLFLRERQIEVEKRG